MPDTYPPSFLPDSSLLSLASLTQRIPFFPRAPRSPANTVAGRRSMNSSTSLITHSKSIIGVPIVVAIGMGLVHSYIRRLIGSADDERNGRMQSEERVTELQKQLKTADKAEQALKQRIEELEKEVERHKASAKQDERDRMRLQNELSKQENTNDTLKSSLHKLQSANATLSQQLTMKTAEGQQLNNELQSLKKRHEETTNLLESRTRELKGSQTFLTKADQLSGQDVISLLDGLNAEILQTAAFIADSFEFSFEKAHAREGGVAEMLDARTKLQDVMGAALLDLLGRVKHEDDPTLIQIALQSSIVEFSRWMISTWDYDVLQAEQPLMEIYQNMRDTENQAVAGRWRALTRAHAQKIAFREEAQHAMLVTHLSEALVLVLVAAGCADTYDATYKRIASDFGARVAALVGMATRLNRAMGEEVTSADLWPAYVEFGVHYNPEEMRDMYAEDGAPAAGGTPPANGAEGHEDAQMVLCTTELGLVRSEKAQTDGKAEFTTTHLVKPKVALESVVDGMEVVAFDEEEAAVAEA